MSSFFNGLILIFSALILGLSGAYLVAREVAPFDFSFAQRSAMLERLASEPAPVPPSIFGVNVALEICDETMSRLSFQLAPSARKEAVARSCLETTNGALLEVPSLSYGHFVASIAHFALEDGDAASAALARSQALGPNEQWIAERRVSLAEIHYDDLGGYAEGGHLADLSLLAQSRQGIRSIAARYVADPEFRERVTGVVETLPAQIQQRFVSIVRGEARTIGGGA